jgi:hypothetical protein
MPAMSYALEIRREESPAPAEGFSLSDLWMLPILLLALIFETFSRHLASLKQMRRSRPFRKDWQSFYPDLRKCEWAIHCFCFEGARQIILGQDLDLAALSYDPEPPDSFQPSMPRSALSMHLRLQDIARFHADPERWIRRHATRLRAASAAKPADAPSPRVVVSLLSSKFFVFPVRFSFSTDARIRAPP